MCTYFPTQLSPLAVYFVISILNSCRSVQRFYVAFLKSCTCRPRHGYPRTRIPKYPVAGRKDPGPARAPRWNSIKSFDRPMSGFAGTEKMEGRQEGRKKGRQLAGHVCQTIIRDVSRRRKSCRNVGVGKHHNQR